MSTQKQIKDSHSPSAAIASAQGPAPYLTRSTGHLGWKAWILFLIILIAFCGAALVLAQPPAPRYFVSNLDSLGGTNSRGNSINNRDWVAGYSNLPGNQSRHAALWRDQSLLDLGT